MNIGHADLDGFDDTVYGRTVRVDGEDFSGVGAVAGFEVVDITVGGLDAEVIGEGHYAAAAVTAHHAARAIRIKERHLEIAALGGQKHHHAVCLEVGAEILDVRFPWRSSAVAAVMSAAPVTAVMLLFMMVATAIMLALVARAGLAFLAAAVAFFVAGAGLAFLAAALAFFVTAAFGLSGLFHFVYYFAPVENDEVVSGA
jgi:hypothetical protein